MFRRFALLVFAALAFSSCSGEEVAPTTSTPATTTTRLVTAEEIVAQAAAAMETVDTLRYSMELSGAPITVLGVELRGATGQYAAPGSSKALLLAAAGDLVVELGTIAIDDTAWVTNPLTGTWDRYTGDRAFNPAIIFDRETGWRPLLTEDFSEGRVLEVKETDGGTRYVVEGSVADRRVEVLTAGLVEAQPLTLILEVDPDSGHVTRMEFATMGAAGETFWTLVLSEFGEPVAIEPPAGA